MSDTKQQSEQKTYLILGANGFVGSYLVDHLSSRANVRVKAFDRFSREPGFSQKDNIEVIKGDILKDSDVDQAMKDVDYVIHSFSATTPFVSDNDPYVDVNNNLIRSIDIFELCVKNNVKKIGFISSGGAVYGLAAERGIVDEGTMPLPVSPYGINKLSIEHYLEYFKRKHHMDYIVYRLTNPYGPRQRSNKNQGVVPIFVDHIINNEEITIFGDGTASRDYIYIDDAAEMIAETFDKKNQHAIYNIGSGYQTDLNSILSAIKTILNTNSYDVTYKEAPATFLQKTQVSTKRFSDEFGKFTLTSLEDGLEKTISDQNK